MSETPVTPVNLHGEADEHWPPAPKPLPADLGPNTDFEIRCHGCHKLLAEFASRPYQLRCPRCKSVLGSGPARAATPTAVSIGP